jgi:transposase
VQKWSQRSSPENKRTRKFLASKQINVVEHPPYSPDLAPVTFSVPEDKVNIERRHFDDVHDIRSNKRAALKAITQNQLQNCFEGRTRR